MYDTPLKLLVSFYTIVGSWYLVETMGFPGKAFESA